MPIEVELFEYDFATNSDKLIPGFSGIFDSSSQITPPYFTQAVKEAIIPVSEIPAKVNFSGNIWGNLPFTDAFDAVDLQTIIGQNSLPNNHHRDFSNGLVTFIQADVGVSRDPSQNSESLLFISRRAHSSGAYAGAQVHTSTILAKIIEFIAPDPRENPSLGNARTLRRGRVSVI